MFCQTNTSFASFSSSFSDLRVIVVGSEEMGSSQPSNTTEPEIDITGDDSKEPSSSVHSSLLSLLLLFFDILPFEVDAGDGIVGSVGAFGTIKLAGVPIGVNSNRPITDGPLLRFLV